MTRTNSTKEGGVREGVAHGHRAAVFAAVLVASAACFALVPGDTLVGALAQVAVLAAVALVAVGLAHPQALGPLRRGALAGWRRWVVYVLVVGLVAGCFASDGVGAGEGLVLRIAYVIALCLLTGVFEEGVFRVLALDALAPALGGGRRGLLRAAVASSVLFGLLHVSVGDVIAAADAVTMAQLALKPLQAGLFGFFMASLYVRTSNLWLLAGVHGAFNLAYTGPSLLASGGLPQTYVTGDPLDLAPLAATTVALVVPAMAAYASLRGNLAAKSVAA